MQINIFTDASITKSICGETIGCSGAICMEDNNTCKFEITRDSTNNISEITAIKLAIELAIENKGRYDIVNIWSDSQWSIFGLTKWITSWTNNITNYQLMNSSGELVKNQQIFLSIIKMIVTNNLRVNFYHIKGHVNEKDIRSINHAVSVFYKSNNAKISRDKIYHAVIMNNMIDNKTRELLKDFKNVQPVKLIRGVINPIITKEEMNIYYRLVTLGGNEICQKKD